MNTRFLQVPLGSRYNLFWASAPAYLVRDNDRAYGHAFKSRVRAMGIRDRPIYVIKDNNPAFIMGVTPVIRQALRYFRHVCSHPRA